MSLLDGVKVIELSTDAGVSACGRVLAGWNAEVLKFDLSAGHAELFDLLETADVFLHERERVDHRRRKNL